MATSQKIILIAIFLNILIGMIGAANNGDSVAMIDAISSYNSQYTQETAAIRDQGNWFEQAWAATGNFMTNIAEMALISAALIKYFVKGIIFFPLVGGSGIELIITMIFGLFVITLDAIILLEAVMLWRNRKTSS